MLTSVRRALTATTLALSLAIPIVAVAPAAATTTDRSPFYVDDIAVRYLESSPVQVQLAISGSLPSPCHEPAWTVADDGAFVIVELWSEADPGSFCATVLQESEVIIDVGAHESAQRAVIVNDRLAATIEVGQPDEATRLVAAGWSFGFCGYYCRADLITAGDRLRLQGADNWGETIIYVNHGTLTSEGSSSLSRALAHVDPATLDSIYGCPDCADGGAAYVELRVGGKGSRHEMPFGGPPLELEELYGSTQSFIGALETCRSDELVVVDDDCTPYEEGSPLNPLT